MKKSVSKPGTSECVGGLLLFLGLGSRLISLPLVADMVGAYVTADREALKSIFSEPGKFYAADPYTFLFASLLILVFGPGKLSLDALMGRFIRWESRVFVNPSRLPISGTLTSGNKEYMDRLEVPIPESQAGR